ncbi:MAG: carboxylating nicotinate-nucleotide diphosphorylase [Bacteroidetes bacterium]|nr:MAG: carboxylating nicotinate-nucleotide diphosphorylase [Bacteroidota bacterium]
MDFLNHPETERIIQAALTEDIGPGDHTSRSTIPAGQVARARCLIKDEGILAGVALAGRIFAAVDPGLRMTVFIHDGSPVRPGDVAFEVKGDPRTILEAERLVLNSMQRMSGIATATRAVVDSLTGLKTRVLDTRKTTPLIRHLEKWAVQIGGGVNHRFGLYDLILIKDNHIDYAGSITAAVAAARAYLDQKGLDLQIEVETRNLDEVREALATGQVFRILLDNMSPALMREAVALIGDQAETEASGGITLETVRAAAEAGVDYVSMGALTHSVRSLDISLKAVTDA